MINYIGLRKYYYIFSGLLLTVSILALLTFKLNVGIDFLGGTNWLITTTSTQSELEQIITESEIGIQRINESESGILLSLSPISVSQKNILLQKFKENDPGFIEKSFETLGPSLGRELLIKTLIAVALASLVIMSYVSYQFNESVFGVTAIIAMLHDVLILLGSFSVLGYFYGVEVDSLFVTALLITLSFSVHDTVVVFDRFREVRVTSSKIPLHDQINLAINSTMVRSINNSITTVFMLLAVFLLGGETIKWFVLALLIGIVVGTYSSPFVSTPLVYEWLTRRHKSN